MRYSAVTGALLAVLAPAAMAAVYRCEEGGHWVYTDQPCAAGAVQKELPPLVVMPKDQASPALSKEYDRRIERERKARDKADAEWLKTQKARKEREDRIHHARIAGQVVKGMSQKQVRDVLGEPAETTHEERAGVAKERWVYRNGTQTQTVNFKDGEVSSVSARSSGKKK